MQENNTVYNQILTLLLKPYWGNQDIQNFFRFTKAPICLKKVIMIRNQAEIDGGGVSYAQCKVSVESVLKVIGKQLDVEIGRYTILCRKGFVDE